MPEFPPQLPSSLGALDFPKACLEISHFSPLFCLRPTVYPWEFAGSVPFEVLFQVHRLEIAFLL